MLEIWVMLLDVVLICNKSQAVRIFIDLCVWGNIFCSLLWRLVTNFASHSGPSNAFSEVFLPLYLHNFLIDPTLVTTEENSIWFHDLKKFSRDNVLLLTSCLVKLLLDVRGDRKKERALLLKCLQEKRNIYVTSTGSETNAIDGEWKKQIREYNVRDSCFWKKNRTWKRQTSPFLKISLLIWIVSARRQSVYTEKVRMTDRWCWMAATHVSNKCFAFILRAKEFKRDITGCLDPSEAPLRETQVV